MKATSSERVRWAVAPPYVWRTNPSRSSRRMSRRIVISDTSKSGELADVDRLLLGDPLEDAVPPVDGGMRSRPSLAAGCHSITTPNMCSETHNKD